MGRNSGRWVEIRFSINGVRLADTPTRTPVSHFRVYYLFNWNLSSGTLFVWNLFQKRACQFNQFPQLNYSFRDIWISICRGIFPLHIGEKIALCCLVWDAVISTFNLTITLPLGHILAKELKNRILRHKTFLDLWNPPKRLPIGPEVTKNFAQ